MLRAPDQLFFSAGFLGKQVGAWQRRLVTIRHSKQLQCDAQLLASEIEKAAVTQSRRNVKKNSHPPAAGLAHQGLGDPEGWHCLGSC